jgi:hypothetical protein
MLHRPIPRTKLIAGKPRSFLLLMLVKVRASKY